MLTSVDSIALVRSYRHIPSPNELGALGFVAKKNHIRESTKWINNGLKGINEPRIIFYETWDKTNRLRIDLSIPNLLFGANIQLPNQGEIWQALEIISNNVEQRTGLKFDSFSAEMCRVDYALNLDFDVNQVKPVIERYRNFEVSRLLRTTVGNETVYFTNKSRTIRIYDKFAEVSVKKSNSELQALCKGIIRMEYSFTKTTSVKSFATRLGFQNASASEMLSQENIAAAHSELNELLKLDSINFSKDRNVQIAFQRTQDIKTAMRLSGFIDAVNCFGEDLHRDNNFKMSKSTYDRNLRECQILGLI